MNISHEQIHSLISIVLCVLIFGLVIGLAYTVLQPKGRVSCADFGSYGDAYNAYQHGAMWLDGNHNGIPCQALYKERGNTGI